jgi:competence protein ComEA
MLGLFGEYPIYYLTGGLFMFNFTRREQLGALLLAGLLVIGLFVRFFLLPGPPGEKIVLEHAPRLEEEEPVEAVLMVHVSGAVRKPGVYVLKQGSRVFEAVEAAGGVLPDGDAHALNLAEPLYDGRKISVPFGSDAEMAANTEGDGRVNINTASAADLEKLPGIGPAKAAAIISYRGKNGPFNSVDQLCEVGGIGLKTVEALKDQITVY